MSLSYQKYWLGIQCQKKAPDPRSAALVKSNLTSCFRLRREDARDHRFLLLLCQCRGSEQRRGLSPLLPRGAGQSRGRGRPRGGGSRTGRSAGGGLAALRLCNGCWWANFWVIVFKFSICLFHFWVLGFKILFFRILFWAIVFKILYLRFLQYFELQFLKFCFCGFHFWVKVSKIVYLRISLLSYSFKHFVFADFVSLHIVSFRSLHFRDL